MFTTLIDTQSLAERLTQADVKIFDCRFDLADTTAGETAYQQAHIPGAIYAHMDDVLSSPITAQSGRHPLPEPQRLIEWLIEQGTNNHQQVVVYDASGGAMAVRLWWLLRWLGHEHVAVLDGGWPKWLAENRETSSTPAKTSHGDFSATPHDQLLVTTQQLVDNLHTPQWQLIDARTSERFNGEQEPIDPVAGHIPGAINLPLQDHLDDNGCFKNASELHALYSDRLGNKAPEECACMCGSGVTACHNLLAMEIAGLKGARLYAGSWSEWIRDPKRPVATHT